MSTAIVLIDSERSMTAARQRKDIVAQLIRDQILRPGIDYGAIPGTDKPALKKPGAERLCSAFQFNPRFETITAIERWDGNEPLFFYRIRCSLVHIESGLEIATGVGSCNSRETKYRWRWVKAEDVPAHLDKETLETRSTLLSEFKFAIEKAETAGKYGKPAAYWQKFKDAIANGSAKSVMKPTAKGQSEAYEIGGLLYRVPNDEIFDLVNTIDKMACKRALVAAALIGANASEFFTQDLDDMEGFGVQYGEDVIEAPTPAIVISPPQPPQQRTHEQSPDPAPEQSSDPTPRISAEDAKAALGNGDKRRITHDVTNLPTRLGKTEPPVTWANEENVTTIVARIDARIPGIQTSEILRYAGIDRLDNYTAWNAKFATGKAAADHILAAWEVDTTPKRKWTADEIDILEKWIVSKFNRPAAEVMKSMNITDWRMDFDDLFRAQDVVIAHALRENWAMVAYSATYDGKEIIFQTVQTIREFSRQKVAGMVGDAYAAANNITTWQASKTPYELTPPLLIHWQKHEGKGQVYYTPTKIEVFVEVAPLPAKPPANDADLADVPF